MTEDALYAAVAALRAADAPDRLEEERARALARLLEHPRIEVELQHVQRRRPNVIARVRGGDGPGLLLAGHFNAGHHPADEPTVTRAGDRIFGGAVTDMLGGLAAMALALREVADGDPPPGDVVLLAAMHEDTIGLGVKAALASRTDWPEYAIWGDPTDLGVVTAHGGAVKFEIALEGRDAHVTRRHEGVDALRAAASLAQAIAEHAWAHAPEERLPELPFALVGELHAGMAPGVVAARAVLRGDVRTVPGMTPASVISELRALAARTVEPDITVRVEGLLDQHPFVAPVPGELVDAISLAYAAERGEAPRVGTWLPAEAFCTEAADLATAGIATVVFGPGDWRWAPGESVALADLVTAARVYAAVAQNPSRNASLYSRYSDGSQPVA